MIEVGFCFITGMVLAGAAGISTDKKAFGSAVYWGLWSIGWFIGAGALLIIHNVAK